MGIHVVRQEEQAERTTRKYPKGAGLQIRRADKREAGSRKWAVVWHRCKFTYFTMTPVLPMATLRKRHEIQGHSAPGLQGAGGRRKRPRRTMPRLPPHALWGIMALGTALGPFFHSFLSSSPLLIFGGHPAP